MRQLTNCDLALQQLKQTILQGWAKDKSQLPLLVTPYFSICDELAVTDGLIFRGYIKGNGASDKEGHPRWTPRRRHMPVTGSRTCILAWNE